MWHASFSSLRCSYRDENWISIAGCFTTRFFSSLIDPSTVAIDMLKFLEYWYRDCDWLEIDWVLITDSCSVALLLVTRHASFFLLATRRQLQLTRWSSLSIDWMWLQWIDTFLFVLLRFGLVFAWISNTIRCLIQSYLSIDIVIVIAIDWKLVEYRLLIRVALLLS